MLYFLRKRDSYFYIILTAFATLSSIYAVYLTADKFGKINFSQFAFFSIIVQIFFTLSDLGTKISYFKNSKTNKKNDYIYLLSSKLILALFLFIFTGFFNNSEIYFSFILTIIGTSIFPFALLQEYKLFCIIGLNNFFFRLIPLLFLSNISSIVQFSYVSGLTIFSFSIYMLIKLKVIKSNSFEFTQFRRYFMNLFID